MDSFTLIISLFNIQTKFNDQVFDDIKVVKFSSHMKKSFAFIFCKKDNWRSLEFVNAIILILIKQYYDDHRCTQRGQGGKKVYPPSKFLAKLVNKNAIKHQKHFYNPIYPSSQNLAKTLLTIQLTIHLDFQTMRIYNYDPTHLM